MCNELLCGLTAELDMDWISTKFGFKSAPAEIESHLPF